MTPSGFVNECSRHGIRLSLALGAAGSPCYAVRIAGKVPPSPKVMDTIRAHKAAIIGALLAARAAGAGEPDAGRSPAPDEPPELLALGREAEEAVQERIAACPGAADQLARVIAAESRATGVFTTPDGLRLYQWGEADWRYVPPGADPADFGHNFPKSYTLPRRWREPATEPRPKDVHGGD